MDANLGCKLQTENIDAMGAIRQLSNNDNEWFFSNVSDLR